MMHCSSVYSSVANTFWPAPGVRASAPSGNTPHSSLRTRIRIIDADCNALWFFSPVIAACSFSGSERWVLPSSWLRSISAVYTFPQCVISMRRLGISFFRALIRRFIQTTPFFHFSRANKNPARPRFAPGDSYRLNDLFILHSRPCSRPHIKNPRRPNPFHPRLTVDWSSVS